MCGVEVGKVHKKSDDDDNDGAPTLCSWVATKVWKPGATPNPSSWTNGGSAWLWICTRTPASNAVSSARKMEKQKGQKTTIQKLTQLNHLNANASKSDFHFRNNLLAINSGGSDSKPLAFEIVSEIGKKNTHTQTSYLLWHQTQVKNKAWY